MTVKVSYATDTSDPLDLMSEEELAQERARQIAAARERVHAERRGEVKQRFAGKEFNPVLHPRDAEGQFAETGGGVAVLPGDTVDTPDTIEELHDTFIHGAEQYLRVLSEHGGPPPDEAPSPQEFYTHANLDEAKPEDVTPEQREVCERAAAEFLADPKMQPLFDAYGTPPIVVASRVCGKQYAGRDPRELGIVAQWTGGTILMFAPTAGDPDYVKKTVEENPGYLASNGEMSMTLEHEYGHHVYGVIGYDEFQDESQFVRRFNDAILGEGDPRGMGEDTAQMNAGQVSRYAEESAHEAFAEFFTVMMGPNFDIDDYDGGARDAFEVLIDKIAEDTNPKDDLQGALFE